MIVLLRGSVLEKAERVVVLDVQGVGYEVSVLPSVAAKLVVGQETVLRTYHDVGEDREALYGFLVPIELRHFELLLSVPSVGPRTAMSILEVAPPKTLARAVAGGDVKLLTKVSGVGRKTAERILVELKEKFAQEPVEGMVGEIHEEVLSALVNLGYTKAQARDVVQKLPPEVATIEEAIKLVLKQQAGAG